jgi:hypothetical protein
MADVRYASTDVTESGIRENKLSAFFDYHEKVGEKNPWSHYNEVCVIKDKSVVEGMIAFLSRKTPTERSEVAKKMSEARRMPFSCAVDIWSKYSPNDIGYLVEDLQRMLGFREEMIFPDRKQRFKEIWDHGIDMVTARTLLECIGKKDTTVICARSNHLNGGRLESAVAKMMNYLMYTIAKPYLVGKQGLSEEEQSRLQSFSGGILWHRAVISKAGLGEVDKHRRPDIYYLLDPIVFEYVKSRDLPAVIAYPRKEIKLKEAPVIAFDIKAFGDLPYSGGGLVGKTTREKAPCLHEDTVKFVNEWATLSVNKVADMLSNIDGRAILAKKRVIPISTVVVVLGGGITNDILAEQGARGIRHLKMEDINAAVEKFNKVFTSTDERQQYITAIEENKPIDDTTLIRALPEAVNIVRRLYRLGDPSTVAQALLYDYEKNRDIDALRAGLGKLIAVENYGHLNERFGEVIKEVSKAAKPGRGKEDMGRLLTKRFLVYWALRTLFVVEYDCKLPIRPDMISLCFREMPARLSLSRQPVFVLGSIYKMNFDPSPDSVAETLHGIRSDYRGSLEDISFQDLIRHYYKNRIKEKGDENKILRALIGKTRQSVPCNIPFLSPWLSMSTMHGETYRPFNFWRIVSERGENTFYVKILKNMAHTPKFKEFVTELIDGRLYTSCLKRVFGLDYEKILEKYGLLLKGHRYF